MNIRSLCIVFSVASFLPTIAMKKANSLQKPRLATTQELAIQFNELCDSLKGLSAEYGLSIILPNEQEEALHEIRKYGWCAYVIDYLYNNYVYYPECVINRNAKFSYEYATLNKINAFHRFLNEQENLRRGQLALKRCK